MSSPVTAYTDKDPWIPLWRYAVALGCATRQLKADLEASAVPVAMVAGEAMARAVDVDAFIEARQAAAQARAEARMQSDLPVVKQPQTRLQRQLATQQAELDRLRQMVAELAGAKA